ncbi:hypothetical protein PR048_030186 [Dryococelus australis]|uniref:HTH CENPB-type domain-containing protein n=1 Tax=Dryococelus australis TaxID=614101 RepID=A0ABQ9GAZ4_9NEOP|nr:hypothetical protein PR048_030186 [Dryococelus australis]
MVTKRKKIVVTMEQKLEAIKRLDKGDIAEGCNKKKRNYENVSGALYVWFTQFRDKGVPISRPVLQQNALQIRNEFNEREPDFTASVGWLDRWKKRYGIHQLSIMLQHTLKAEELQDGDIKTMFLPPNATTICKPMDQSILETSKRNYRRKLLSTMIEEIDGHNMT